jgi:erythromycin esterase-like protein
MNNQTIIDQIHHDSIPLHTAADLQKLVDAIGDAKFVLLGEASHGTSEFYTWRIELSKLLIEQKGFTFIAVEGDWPSCYNVNRYVKQYEEALPTSKEVLAQFNRWPTWMWANQEILQWIEWLRADNETKDQHNKVGFYGLDMYSLWESMEEIIRHLKATNAPEEQIALAEKAFSCFEPYGDDGQLYGFSAWSEDADCTDEVVQLLKEMQRKHPTYDSDNESAFSSEMNALVAVHAEKYYRSMIRGGPDSWNIRDRHMTEALQKLTEFHGEGAKAIVWEHNTHIGDARATDMKHDGMVNVGQLVREQYGRNQVFAVGFGSYEGTVIAAQAWGAPTQTMQVPQAIRNSWEHLFHEASASDQLIIFEEDTAIFKENRGHRAIGVVYHPHNERGNYVPTILSARYDAFIYLDQTHALQPLEFIAKEPMPLTQ